MEDLDLLPDGWPAHRTFTTDSDFLLCVTPASSRELPRVIGWVDQYGSSHRVSDYLRPGESLTLRWRSAKWGPDGSADTVAERTVTHDDLLAMMTPETALDAVCVLGAGAKDNRCWRISR